ncbi:MAG: TolC family protein [Planctomycetes bacterium]|nr:TolC family protein [Planctomycetota bacterium]
MKRRLHQRIVVSIMLLAALAQGCSPSRPFYFRDDGDMSHYLGVATKVEYPDTKTDTLLEVTRSQAPLTVSNSETREVWDLTLQDAIQSTLGNSKVMRSLGAQAFISPSLAGGSRFGDPTRLTTAPATVQTTFGPSIVESNPQTGVEAALSQFDAQFSSNTFWQKNDRPQNSVVAINGVVFQPAIYQQDYAQQTNQLSKKTATGGTAYLRNHTYYDMNNSGTLQFHNVWQPDIEMEFDHPLLQGAGAQFNRIAGPNSTPGNYTGVEIARINHDQSVADVEIGVRNLVQEVELTYWRLYYNYRDLDAKVAGRDSALATWRKIYALYRAGSRGGEAEKEAQARAQYFLFRSQVEGSLSDLYTSENQLRYMMGLAPTDGRLIRPADEPTTARVVFDWQEINSEAMMRAPELRKQRWFIKQHELQLIAAKNYLLPQLTTQALYRWRGLGNNLLNSNQFTDNRLGQNVPFGSAWGSLLGGNYQEWQLGVNFQMPLGFRQGLAAVRNEQLQLARERAILQDQELEVSHQLTNAIRNLDRFYALCQTNFNRRVAAERQVTAVRAAYDAGTVTLDLLLDAQRQLADAESTYYDVLALYNQTISQVHTRKGSLLEYNGVYLSEGPWADKAYVDARKRAQNRDSGMFINYGFTRPNVVSRGAINQLPGVNLGSPPSAQPTPATEQPAAEQVAPPPASPAPGQSTSINRLGRGEGVAAAGVAGQNVPAIASVWQPVAQVARKAVAAPRRQGIFDKPFTEPGSRHAQDAHRTTGRANQLVASRPGSHRQFLGA